MANGRERLKSNPYPGRGIILGLDASGRYALQIYWITARSTGSKNRILEIEGEDIRTRPFDAAERSDDPNIWYRAVARAGDRHAVSNGIQTDTVIEHLSSGAGSFESALLTHVYENDAPNFTARISGLIDLSENQPRARLSKITHNSDDSAAHAFYVYQQLTAGTGYCLHTYAGDGNPLPAFASDPYEIDLKGTPEEAVAEIWGLLPDDKRVAIALKAIDIESKQVVTLKVTNTLG